MALLPIVAEAAPYALAEGMAVVEQMGQNAVGAISALGGGALLTAAQNKATEMANTAAQNATAAMVDKLKTKLGNTQEGSALTTSPTTTRSGTTSLSRVRSNMSKVRKHLSDTFGTPLKGRRRKDYNISPKRMRRVEPELMMPSVTRYLNRGFRYKKKRGRRT